MAEYQGPQSRSQKGCQRKLWRTENRSCSTLSHQGTSGDALRSLQEMWWWARAAEKLVVRGEKKPAGSADSSSHIAGASLHRPSKRAGLGLLTSQSPGFNSSKSLDRLVWFISFGLELNQRRQTAGEASSCSSISSRQTFRCQS